MLADIGTVVASETTDPALCGVAVGAPLPPAPWPDGPGVSAILGWVFLELELIFLELELIFLHGREICQQT